MTTMLQLMQQASAEMGLTVPSSVAGNTAADVVQTLALLNAVGYELKNVFEWQKLSKEYRFTTEALTTTGDTTINSAVITGIPSTTGLGSTYMVTGTNVPQDTYVSSVDSATQVTLSNASTGTETGADLVFSKTQYSMPSDFDRLINRTEWDKNNHWELIGPESAQEWQWLKSGYIQTTPRVRFRQLGGYFQIWPPTGVEDLYGFEYVSNNWVTDSGGTGKTSFTADDDTCIFKDRLMVLGVKLKYFEIKGFDTTAFARDYQVQRDSAMSGDAGAPTLSLSRRNNTLLIGYNSIPDSGYGT
jgi:hypothetical protein